jgi:hypothetical protein
MTNTDKAADKADANKTREAALEQEELSAEDLSKIAGGDMYIKPFTEKGIS